MSSFHPMITDDARQRVESGGPYRAGMPGEPPHRERRASWWALYFRRALVIAMFLSFIPVMNHFGSTPLVFFPWFIAAFASLLWLGAFVCPRCKHRFVRSKRGVATILTLRCRYCGARPGRSV